MKRAQVTIFIIIGVVFILAIILFFFLFVNEPEPFIPPSTTPRNFIEQCVMDSVQPSIDSVLEYGGLIGPRNFIMRNDHEYNYLCFTDQYYAKCINKYPMLKRITQEEIRKDSVDRINECFDYLVRDYESRGFEVEHKPLDYTVQIVPGSIRLLLQKNIVASKETDVQEFDDFDMQIPSDLYELISFAREIVNQEAEFCYFESNGFMILYPKYNVTRFDFVESKIYELQNRQTKETLKFAIRSCPFPPGFQ